MADSVVLITRKQPRDKPFPVAKGQSHFHRLIATLPEGPYYTIKEAAWLVERKPKTVKKWIREGRVDQASKFIRVFGELVYLYTEDDIERLRIFAENQ